MATAHPLFDMSKATPLPPDGKPLFDMSKATALNPNAVTPVPAPPQPLLGSATQRLFGGHPVSDAMSSVGNHIKDLVMVPYNAFHAFHEGPQTSDEVKEKGTNAESGFDNFQGQARLGLNRMLVQPTVQGIKTFNEQRKAGNTSLRAPEYDDQGNYTPTAGSGLADAIPLIGPYARGIENEAHKKGALAAALGVGVDTVLPHYLNKGVAAALKSPTNVVAKLAASSGPKTTPMIEATLPDIQASVKAHGAPTSIADFKGKTVKLAKDKLNAEYTAALGPYKAWRIEPSLIVDRLQELYKSNMPNTVEGKAAAAAIKEAVAEFSGKKWSLQALDDERMTRNAELNRFRNGTAVERYTKAKGNINVAIDQAVADGVRDTVYPMMDTFANKPLGYFGGLKSRIGNLMELDSSLEKHIENLHDTATRVKGAPRLSRAQITATALSPGTTSIIKTALDAMHTPNVEAAANAGVKSAFRKGVKVPRKIGVTVGMTSAGLKYPVKSQPHPTDTLQDSTPPEDDVTPDAETPDPE